MRTAYHLFVLAALVGGCGEPPPDADGDGSPTAEDCDDADRDVRPGAPERCNGIDDDCDGAIDEDDAVDAPQHWVDDDGDGFGAGEPERSCRVPADRVLDGRDCDDSDETIFPGAVETCDEADRDCDGDPYAGAVDPRPRWSDVDGDGAAGTPIEPGCVLGEGEAFLVEDCDDADPEIAPGVPEVCDGIDQDCDGSLGFDAVVRPTDDLSATLQGARDGDRVCVLGGTHTVSATLGPIALTLAGEGADRTTLEGGEGRILDLRGTDLVASGLTLRGGVADRGALVRASGGRLDLSDSLLEGPVPAGSAPVEGLALATRGTAVRLAGVRVEGLDLADLDGGRGVALALDGGRLDLDGLVLADSAVSGAGVGGLIAIDGATLEGGGLSLSRVDAVGLETGLISLSRVDGGLVGVVLDGVSADGGPALDLVDADLDLTDVDLLDVASTAAPVRTTGASTWTRLRLIATEAPAGEALLDLGGPTTLQNLLVTDTERVGTAPVPAGVVRVRGRHAETTVRLLQASLFDPGPGAAGGVARVDLGDLEVVNVDVTAAHPVHVLAVGPAARAEVRFVNLQAGGTAAQAEQGAEATATDVLTAAEPGYADTSDPDPRLWDLSLPAGAALRDAGDPEILDADGSRSDIGASGGPSGGGW